MRALLVSLLPGLCAACGQEPRTADVLLDRHLAALGGPEILAVDLAIEGTFERDGRILRQRTLVRRQPFGFRQEVIETGPTPQRLIAVSDGRYVWTPHAEAASRPGTPLRAELACGYLEGALVDGQLCFSPRFRATAVLGHGTRLPERAGLPPELASSAKVVPVALHAATGALVTLFLDAEDGQLRECTVESGGPRRWMRYGSWRAWIGIRFPALAAAGVEGSATVTVLRIQDARAGGHHAAELFAGSPVPAIQGMVRAGRLSVLPHTDPGSGHLVLEGVRIQGSGPQTALVDTGAYRSAVAPEVAAAQKLPLLGFATLRTFTGGTRSRLCWIETLDLGARSALQVVANAVPLPLLAQVYEDRQVRALVGGAELLADAPVLDLTAGELLLRGSPAPPLAEPGGASRPGRVITLPCAHRPENPATITVTVEVQGRPVAARVDTGADVVLRLSRPALLRAGLPTDPQEWRRRGALPKSVGAAGGGEAVELLVLFDEVRLGPIVFERPVVQVAPASDIEHALLGTGALLPFAKVGIDLDRGCIELVPGPEVRQGPDGSLRVPSAGVPLGFAVRSPPSTAVREPECLPIVFEVVADSPAGRAGVRPNDRLLAIDGIPCARQTSGEFNRRLWLQPGRSVTLELLAGGARRRARVVSP